MQMTPSNAPFSGPCGNIPGVGSSDAIFAKRNEESKRRKIGLKQIQIA
jgi:hypothetical protein